MKFQLRDYQQNASNAAIAHYRLKGGKNYLMVLPTGAGKSIVIADIAARLNEPLLVFQPNKEILEQNFAKLQTYGIFDAGCYSASVKRKDINRITFATIGSVYNHMDDFKHFKYVLIDECFPYKQFVSTQKGKMRIGVLCKLFEAGKALPKVLSYDEKNNCLIPNKITAVRCNGVKGVFRLKFNESFTLKVTDNHPFLTESGWKTVRELNIGDAVLSAYPEGAHLKIPNQDQIEFLLGSLVGDGSLDKTRKTLNANRFRFVQGEGQREYLEWKASMLGCADKVQKVEHNGFAGKPAYRFNSEVMYVKDDICNKRYAIENLTLKSLAIIYMDDGHLSNGQYGATICSVAESEDLTELLVLKLQSWGISCSARKSKSSLTHKEYSYVGIRTDGVKTLCRLIAPYVHSSMKDKLIDEYKDLAGTYKWNDTFGKFGCSIFLGKEYVGEEEVYNMEVENSHTYVVTSSRYDKSHKDFDNGLIVHNCHLVNPSEGMYADFFSAAERRIIGLTATPYRLSSTMNGSMLKFLTRTRPRVFSDVIYYCQVSELLARGFLTKLKYYDLTRIELVNVRRNSTGADFDDRSLSKEFERVDLYGYLISMVRRLLAPKSGIPRRGILVFTRFVKEAEMLTHEIPDSAVVSGTTPKKERERILSDFKSGKIKVVANCGVLTTGFDYPELDTIVLCRPTMSLALYYQMIGRVIRPYPGKEGWVVDLCGNLKTFGKVEDLRIEQPEKGKWMVKTNGKQLTNVIL